MIYSKVLDKIQELLGSQTIISVQRLEVDKVNVYNIQVEDKYGNDLKPISIGIREAQLINTLNAIYRVLAFKAKQEDLADQALSAMHPEL